MSLSHRLVLLKLIVFTSVTQLNSQNSMIFENNQHFLGDSCLPSSGTGSVIENGKCTFVENCPVILETVKQRLYDYRTCGYEGPKEIVCCPFLNLTNSLECTIHGTSQVGVLKFYSDCGAINEPAASQFGKYCNGDICSDLICCPITTMQRLKQVCSYVDHPIDTLLSKLHQHMPCTVTVRGMKVNGLYQKNCDLVKRHPEFGIFFQNVCNDDTCNEWLCCPIENSTDNHYCSNKIPVPNIKLIGPRCTDSKSGRTGTCRSELDCPGYNITQLDTCGTYCCFAYYCCPDSIENVSNELLSVQKCWEYSKFVNKAEITISLDLYVNRTVCSPEILPVGGKIVEPGEYPHMASLGYEKNNDIEWKCGGSLISDQYVLTAAHCLIVSSEFGVLKVVRLGVIDLSSDTEVKDCPEDFQVIRVIKHPDYKPNVVYNDIGLIQLQTKVKFNFHIRPICLPSNSNLPNRFQSMGWGDLGPNNGKTIQLIKVDQNLYTYEKCEAYYKNNGNRKLIHIILNDTQVCAGSIIDNQGTCRGDSGGPLLANHPKISNMFEIYGIVSAGVTCGFVDSPGIYTKVYPFKSWIENIVYNS